MFQPRPISKESIPQSLQKAERYRVINDPSSAESICLDILAVEPGNQQALVTLLLAITDQFGEAPTEGVHRAKGLLAGVGDAYKRDYYAGIIAERCAKAQVRRGGLNSGEMAYHSFREAMSWYEKAGAQRPPGNDEAILRWNACARILMQHPAIAPRPEERAEPVVGE